MPRLIHMYNPLGVMDKVYQDLKPGGMFYIQTVNDNQALKDFCLMKVVRCSKIYVSTSALSIVH